MRSTFLNVVFKLILVIEYIKRARGIVLLQTGM
jgi:hypothetical protein